VTLTAHGVFPSISLASGSQIYLTFDDGPPSGSENILQVPFEERVPATMFTVGVHVETKAMGKPYWPKPAPR